jgi:2-oxoglutarate ferredoxin oxidoreductase subunit beta
MSYLAERRAAGEIVTGLLFVDPEAADLHDAAQTVDQPLNQLDDTDLCPGSAILDRLNASLR